MLVGTKTVPEKASNLGIHLCTSLVMLLLFGVGVSVGGGGDVGGVDGCCCWRGVPILSNLLHLVY